MHGPCAMGTVSFKPRGLGFRVSMFNRTSGLGLKGESCVANLNLRG